MKTKYILLLLLLMNFTGCVTIIKWKYGITNPKEQTPEKLIAFLEKHKYPDSSLFIFDDSLSFFRSLRNPLFRKNLLSHLIFDSTGVPLRRDTSKCQWSGYDVIKTLHPDSAYMKLNGLQLADILNHIHQIGSTSVQLGNPLHPAPDFTIIVTWAKFLGTYNSRLFELSEAVSQNKTARIRLIWLNIDMQENWHLTKNQKMEIR